MKKIIFNVKLRKSYTDYYLKINKNEYGNVSIDKKIVGKVVFIKYKFGSYIILSEKIKGEEVDVCLLIYEYKRYFPNYRYIKIENGYILIIDNNKEGIVRMVYNGKRFSEDIYINNNIVKCDKFNIMINNIDTDSLMIYEQTKGILQKTYFIKSNINIEIKFHNNKKIMINNLDSYLFSRRYN